MNFKTTKICQGYYRVTAEGSSRAFIIDHVERSEGLEWSGWIAREDKMVPDCVSEPLRTKAEAVRAAQQMLAA